MVSRGFCYLSILLFIVMQARDFVRDIPSSSWIYGEPQIHSTDPESKLARGERLDLKDLDLYAIELIAGMGEDLAPRVLEKREQILRKANDLDCAQKYKAFEVVKGIGAKTARKLAEFVRLDDRCEERQ